MKSLVFMQRFLHALLVFVFSLGVSPAEAQDRRLNRELATDRLGGDFRAFRTGSDELCASACEADSRCLAYTFALPGAPRGAGTCWLKDRPTQPTDATGLVSGVRGGIGDLVVVVANLRGSTPMETATGLFPPTLDFQARARRLADAVFSQGSMPDLVLLTEVAGWGTCGGAGDYDQIDHLLARIRANFGVTLRIAYLVGAPHSFGWFRQCSTFEGQAILYNPSRLINRTPEDPGLVLAHDAQHAGISLRRSLPVCTRGSSLTPIESLLDGPPQMDKCNRPTPSGPAYVMGGHRASGARFSFQHDRRTSFDVFVIQPSYGSEQAEAPLFATFLDWVQAPPLRSSRVALPAIIGGDFNGLARKGWPANSAMVFAPEADVMQLSLSQGQLLPARLLTHAPSAHVLLPAGAPTDPDSCNPFIPNAFSDHCGLLVRLNEVQPPPVLPPRISVPFRPPNSPDPYEGICLRNPWLQQCRR